MSGALLLCACLAVAANPPGALQIWGPAEEGHKQTPTVLAFSPDGTQLATGGRDRTVRLWDLETGKLRHKLGPRRGWVQGLSFSPDGRRLVSGGLDRTLAMWDVESGALIREMNGHTDGITSACWLPTGGLIATGGRDKTTRLWDAATGENTAVFPQPEGWVLGVGIVGDARRLATFTGRGEEPVAFWDAERGEQDGALRRNATDAQQNLMGFAVSGDGQRVAFAGPRNNVEIWRPQGPSPSLRLAGHTAEVGAVAFSPNGKIAASAATDNTVRLWDLDLGKPIITLIGHESWAAAVTFAPDGRRLASGSGDSKVILWDWAEALEFEHHIAGGQALGMWECWESLASDDPVRAHMGIWTLVSHPDDALELLAEKVAATPHDDRRALVERLLVDLEDDRPAVRQAAVEALDKQLTDVEPLLAAALAEPDASLEVKHQLQMLLSPQRSRTIRRPERLQALRAVQVLEHIGSEKAQAHLAELADGAPGDILTEDARAAVQRLEAAARWRR